jgi:hypothetical protein
MFGRVVTEENAVNESIFGEAALAQSLIPEILRIADGF